MFRDDCDHLIQYEPVAVIEYQGHVSRQGDSEGHYICDIKDRLTGWFRTNDNKVPIPIEFEEVSDLAYVILYRKIE